MEEERIANDKDEEVVAVLEDIVHGRHGPYCVTSAIAGSDIEGSITFSLSEKVWQEEDLLEESDIGGFVVLNKLITKHKGWRARKARIYNEADEKKWGLLATIKRENRILKRKVR